MNVLFNFSNCLSYLQASSGVSDEDFVSYVCKWRDAGASLIGGCCRTTPRTIKAISRVLSKDLDNLSVAQK